ncbi:MAG TPA: TIGR03619 family F420-dependent LLM class oxidoreductase [Candidatus Binatia bacterium]|nr:TIGR03619 family F420-dependent LLM class oxidoreductase [Candidatus Binatia bacterium]
MKVGIPLFMLRPAQLVPVARLAEELGFESVWVPEHLVFPAEFRSRYPYTETGVPPVRPATPLLDPLLVLAQVAGATSRIRLGTNIYLLPLRHPVVAARLVTTLDVLSSGRLSFGVGTGWLAEEFEAVGISFADRGAMTRECVRAMKALWSADEPEHHGHFFSFGPVKFEPKPVQKPHPPILFGGETEAALRRAAALGDGWYGVGHTPDSAAKHVGRLRTLRADAGRASEPFEVTVGASAAALDRAELQRFADAGVDRAVALPWTRASEAEASLRRFAERVAA